MKNSQKYLVVKDTKYKKICLSNNKIEGYSLIKNKKKKIRGITIKNMIVVNGSLIEQSVDKKIKRQFKLLLEFIASICENDDSSNGMVCALNEIEKFRRRNFFYFSKLFTKSQFNIARISS